MHNDPWTLEQRTTVWIMFLTSGGTARWGRMMAATGKDYDALRSEIWKLYRADPKGGETYWDKQHRLDMMISGRTGEPFSSHEDKIIEAADYSKIPAGRIAQLTGRTIEQIRDRLIFFKTHGRKSFGLTT